MSDEVQIETPIEGETFYHAPIHHRALTETPTEYAFTPARVVSETPINHSPAGEPVEGAIIQDSHEATWSPHRLPPHPDPAHHRPVHVASLDAAQQLAQANTPPLTPDTQVIGAPGYPAIPQAEHFDYRGHPVVTHGGAPAPTNAPAPLATVQTPNYPGNGASYPGAPAGAYAPQQQYQPARMPAAPAQVLAHKRVSHWPAALISGILAAVLASVGTAAWLSYHPVTAAPSATTPSVIAPAQPNTPSVPTAPGPVDGSTATNPYWQGVAATVAGSVVAIQASTTGGGSVGSGFILDSEGHVLTNNHVIAGANNNQVQVTLADGRLYHATIVGGDTFTDLAVVKLQNEPADLRPVMLGNSDELYVGDPVAAIGNPLGLANTLTTGVISAINRPVTATGQDGIPETVTNAIQIDAAINPGNSGGPLFDHQGRVIGVTSSIASLSAGIFGGQAGSIGLGFAIPINLAQHISEQIIENGEAQHPRLGVSLTSTTATADGISRRGARIESVNPGTAAADAGLQEGDVVVAFNGLPVSGSDSLTGFVRERRVGDVVELTIIRDGQVHTITATLGAMSDVAEVAVPEPELTVPPEGDIAPETEDENWLDEFGYEYGSPDAETPTPTPQD